MRRFSLSYLIFTSAVLAFAVFLGTANSFVAHAAVSKVVTTTVKTVVKKPTPVIKRAPAKKAPAPKPKTVVKATQVIVEPKLTVAGVLAQTNLQRMSQGALSTLSENEQLSRAALVRMHDMFNKQYFDHVSPTGVQPSAIVSETGYSYITFGENIALGDFTSDKALVDAWMNSPHHRENILNAGFTEIGIAVGKSYYQGKLTWIAVQEFAKPRAACPIADENLKAIIDGKAKRIALMNQDADRLLSELKVMRPTNSDEITTYNQKANAYNDLANQLNTDNATLRNLIIQYNNQVDTVNQCLNKK